MTLLLPALLIAALIALSAYGAQRVDFVRDIKPILQRNCYKDPSLFARVAGMLTLLSSCAPIVSSVTVVDAVTDRPIPNALVYGRRFMLRRPPVAAISKTDLNGKASFTPKLLGASPRFDRLDVVHPGYFPKTAGWVGEWGPVRLLPLPANRPVSQHMVRQVNSTYVGEMSSLIEVSKSPGSGGSLSPSGLWELRYEKTTEASLLAPEWKSIWRSYIQRGLSDGTLYLGMYPEM